jgi:cellulose synthase/poly-beta-1,6-N-acetylglucosamine synthase-like glycosyltransferase
MTRLAAWVCVLALAVPVYAYLLYPGLLWLLTRRRRQAPVEPHGEWPLLCVTVPAYNEEGAIAATLDRVLAADYPPERRQILVVSDASSDRTDDIVLGYADRGVGLLRLPQRAGKTAAENAAWPHLHGDIVINTDASVRVDPGAFKALVRAFADPTVGVASSRDVSVASLGDTANVGEGRYVGYEMWVRGLETRLYGIVGASGSLYAIRAALHRTLVPEALSRDFAAALIAREQGYRAVSVENAICYVPRGTSLRREYRRKVRTMARGLETLWYKRHLLNPVRHGVFAWMLWSHKALRWLVPWSLVVATLGILVAAVGSPAARVLAVPVVAVLLMGGLGWLMAEHRPPRALALPAYLVSGTVAALHAWIKALSGELNPVWEPTRRAPTVSQAGR